MTTKISKSHTVAYSYDKGKTAGRELGIAEGEAKSKRETARKMLSMGMDKDTILQVTDQTEEELSALGDR